MVGGGGTSRSIFWVGNTACETKKKLCGFIFLEVCGRGGGVQKEGKLS